MDYVDDQRDYTHCVNHPESARGEALRARDHEHVQAAVELLGLLPHRDLCGNQPVRWVHPLILH